jgi:hypothetical protein
MVSRVSWLAPATLDGNRSMVRVSNAEGGPAC